MLDDVLEVYLAYWLELLSAHELGLVLEFLWELLKEQLLDDVLAF
jgi:hypothetical protein